MFKGRQRRRKPSAHEKQIQFFTVFAGVLMVGAVVVILWWLNSVYQPTPR